METPPKVIVDPEVLESFLKTLDDMKANNALTEAQYYMCVLTMAYEFLIKHHNVDRTMALLNVPTPEYYRGAFKEQVHDDKLFAHSMFTLVYNLIALGLTDIELEKPNQPAAEA